ncbi:MAG TPA: nucleotidyltransferase family protein, partial [Burkholderiales bacterium]|nr:nucleotidyltransferase family protein [Burkholderiales bacterium]
MKGMILAAGRGERMRPLTDHVPKPLLPVGGKPLIIRLIEALVQAGVAELVINTSHLASQIESTVGHGAAYGARIVYSHEEVALETAGGIALALKHLGDAPFVVVNGDICTDFDFARLPTALDAGHEVRASAHLVLVDNPVHHPAGDFCLNEGMVTLDEGTRLTFSGIGVYRPRLFAHITPGTRYQLATVLRAAMARGEVT